MSSGNTSVQSIIATEADFEPHASLAPIKEHFCKHDSEYWNTNVKNHMLSGYITLPNKAAWNTNFILGGTDFACLTPLIFEPYTYTQDYEKFNTYGNLFMGDCISLLNSCSQFGITEMNVLDFGIIITFIATAFASSILGKKSWTDGRASIDWITRCFLAALTKHNKASNTEINLHISDFFSICGQFNDFISSVNEVAKEVKMDPIMYPGEYQSLVVSAYFSLISGLNTRTNFKTPNLVVHEIKMTAKERQLVECCSDEYEEYLVTREMFRKGLAKFCTDKHGRMTDEQSLINSADNLLEEPYFPNQHCARIHNYLHTRKRKPPEFLTVVFDNPCRICDKLPKTPIASCTLDVNKLAFDNATKDDSWVLSSALLQYSYAQEINKLRRSFQSHGKDNPLLVKITLPNNRPELVDMLKNKIAWSTSILRSTDDLDYIYEFIESE